MGLIEYDKSEKKKVKKISKNSQLFFSAKFSKYSYNYDRN